MSVDITPYRNLHLALFGVEPADPESAQFLDVLVQTLPDRHAIVLRKRFGMDSPALTLREVGELLNRSRSAASRVERDALRMMRDPLRYQVFKKFVDAPHKVRRDMLSLTSIPALARWHHDSYLSVQALSLPGRCRDALKKLGVNAFDDLPLPVEVRNQITQDFSESVIKELESRLASFGVCLFAEESTRTGAEVLARLDRLRPAPVNSEALRRAAYLKLIRDVVPRSKNELPAIDDEDSRFVDILLGTLDDKSALVIRKLYGLDGSAMTKHAVGELLGVSDGRMPQIVARAFRMLSHPVRSDALLEFLFSPASTRQAMISLTSVDALCQRKENVAAPLAVDLDLSVRAYQTLQALGVDNANDLPLPPGSRKIIPAGIGKTTIAEIEQCLDQYGLRLFAE